MQDSTGRGVQHISKKVLQMIAPFSDELLAHRCGISDVIFEEGCVILDMFLQQQMQKSHMYRDARWPIKTVLFLTLDM